MKTMSETRLTEGPLHHLDGKLAECGWATSLLRAYDRDRIKAPKRRIKEWDYYLVNDDEFAVALTVADMGYVGLISASVMDFAQATSHTASVISPFPMGRFKLPATSAEGVTSFENNRVSFRFEVAGGQRRLNVWFAGFDGGDDLTFEAVLDEEPRDSMVISTPWAEDPLAFYYNQKIVAMQARGSFKKGLLVHGFCPENSFGLLDWGRGVWTRDNTWYWAVAQGWQDGRRSASTWATGSATRRRLPRTWCSSTVLRTSCTAWTSASPKRRAARTRRRRPIATSSCSPGI